MMKALVFDFDKERTVIENQKETAMGLFSSRQTKLFEELRLGSKCFGGRPF
jgi:hypothetical protein